MAPGRIDSKSESESLLLVEGVNDCHAIHQIMWLVHKQEPLFGIHECGNDDGALDSLSARLVTTEPRQKILGLVLDSDIAGLTEAEVIQARLNQLVSRINPFYKLPSVFPEAGMILMPRQERADAARLPKLGVWLMPNNKAYGMLEDLLSASLRENEFKYTETVVRKAKIDQIATYRDTHLAKAIIRSFMAWQDPPDIQYIGQAIRNGTFTNLVSECDVFVHWLEGLFGKPRVFESN